MNKNYLYLYPILLIAFFIQVTVKNVWMPDLALILVVFAGIFRASMEVFVFGLIAGLLRGCFSPGTFYLDIFLFPAAGFTASLLAGLFYKYNSLVHVVVTSFVMLLVMAVQVFFMNSAYDNNIAFFSAILTSWRTFLTTMFLAPFVFSALKGLWCLDE